MPAQESTYEKLWRAVRRFIMLKTEDVKLTLSEKITVLISTVAVAAILALIGGTVLLFLTFAAAHWIGESLGMAWAFLIISGVYLVALVTVIVLRRPLIINPVARFVTRLILS